MGSKKRLEYNPESGQWSTVVSGGIMVCMKQAWLMVIDELVLFVRSEIENLFFGVVGVASKASDIQSEQKAALALPSAESHLILKRGEAVPILPTIPDILHEPVVMYVSAPRAVCFSHPHVDFDGELACFPYGSAVTVVSFFGRYARVQRQEIIGWVLKDELTQTKSAVWPILTNQVVYEAAHDVVKKIRLVIGDEFNAGKLALPLQAGEYISYRLRLDNRRINWPLIRPRTPGSWQKILRGVPGIHIGVAPKTDTIMEWSTEAGEGRLAYVEKVLPDMTLEVTLVGGTEAGLFAISTLATDVWREYRPVFIEIK